MVRQLIARVLVSALTLWPIASSAASMSDLWWNPYESGWGANIIDQQGTLFITLFVYGPSGQPTWLVGSDVSIVSSTSSERVYSGALYSTTGPWFGGYFDPSSVHLRQVGTLTFTATSPVKGTITYSVDGVVVSKAVERLTWKHINLGGTYYGAVDALSSSTCSLSGSASQPFYASQSITANISAVDGRRGSIVMAINDGFSTITFSGTYVQYGALYEVSGSMNYLGTIFAASIRDFTADDDGIRGNIYMYSPAGCVVNLRFSAVRPG